MADTERVEGEEYEVLDLSAMRRNRTYIQQMFGDVTRQSAAKQVMIGGASGWLSGYLSVKVGKMAALSVGGSVLLIRIAQHKGYLKIDWKKVNHEVNKARETVEREAARQYPQLANNVQRFVQENIFLAGSFAGGFLLGVLF